MQIFTESDVDKFFDKFEDPAYEVERIIDALIFIKDEVGGELYEYFIKRLIMKSYRLGKEHAYAGVFDVIRDRR